MNLRIKRELAIGKAMNTIKKCLALGKHIDDKAFVSEIMRTEMVSERTAKEYLDSAHNNIEISNKLSAQSEL